MLDLPLSPFKPCGEKAVDARAGLHSGLSTSDRSLVVHLVDKNKQYSTKLERLNEEQIELIRLTESHSLNLMMTIIVPDVLVDEALAAGQDPASAVAALYDRGIGQWVRRHCRQPIPFIRVLELASSSDINLRSPNRLHGLHAHMLISVPLEQLPAFTTFLAAESTRLDQLASNAAGRAPRRAWRDGDVWRHGCGVPIHLRPVDSPAIAVIYATQNLAFTRERLGMLMRVFTNNKRQPRPLFISTSITKAEQAKAAQNESSHNVPVAGRSSFAKKIAYLTSTIVVGSLRNGINARVIYDAIGSVQEQEAFYGSRASCCQIAKTRPVQRVADQCSDLLRTGHDHLDYKGRRARRIADADFTRDRRSWRCRPLHRAFARRSRLFRSAPGPPRHEEASRKIICLIMT